MKQEKIDFIKNELTALVVKAYSNVLKLIPLSVNDNDDIDYVLIIYNTGCFEMVNITCNSLLFIARDVLKRI